MGKRDLSEEDIKARYITPAVEQSGWDKKQIRYEYPFTAGRKLHEERGNVQIIYYFISTGISIHETNSTTKFINGGYQKSISSAPTT